MDYKERKARKGHPVGIAVPVSERWNGMVEWMAKREKGKGERGKGEQQIFPCCDHISVVCILYLYVVPHFVFLLFSFSVLFLVSGFN